MSNKPEFNDSDLTRWQEALASGSTLRFEQGSAALLIHTLGELETFLQLDPGTLAPVSPQLEESIATVEELQSALEAAQVRIAELEGTPGLPADALERIKAVKGVGDRLADEILAALTSTTSTD
jgi:hypothetical protein